MEAGGDSTPRRLLGATLAIGVLALLTGGLHLDGLADTADGLGSRRPRDEALAIMRRSDIGPFGVVALLFAVGVQVTGLAAVQPGWPGAAALAVAVVTGRVAVVLAAGSPAARPDGFGALVAGSTTAPARDRGGRRPAGGGGRGAPYSAGAGPQPRAARMPARCWLACSPPACCAAPPNAAWAA